ncbi:helix-turn-helix domain-containing protein [Sphingobacteriaceae bacterium AH-315-L07]|nr:helix-turn-helix domain-containing protein [Sphingobacteriaceae bacterium AH-315-L07]
MSIEESIKSTILSSLKEFKIEVIEELRDLIQKKATSKWLKNSEVHKIYGISTTKLQNLRIQGLPFTKVNGTIYYRLEDIEKLFTDNLRNI